MKKRITLPLSKESLQALCAGDEVLLSGDLYTARDAAHKRMYTALKEGKPLPFDIKNATVYYVGPTPAKAGQIIGSAGPTTSQRMDAYAPALIEAGLCGMIGKGDRGEAVIFAMKTHSAVYFAALGGAGALLADCVRSSEVVAYEDLGTEAVRKLSVENLPVIVAIDSCGCNLYEKGPKAYLESIKKEP